jgi:6-pyruvoyltetrahydropterin/6-carboxytetrahydropterin synthase
MDFGGLKKFKEWADHMFDHTLLVDKTDPMIDHFLALGDAGLADIRPVPGVGCEMFAKLCWDRMAALLDEMKDDANPARYPVNPSVRIKSAEVFEHGANSAIYEG